MRIYYQTPSVLITECEFRVSGRPPRRLDEFDDFYVVHVSGTEDPQWTVRRIWPALLAISVCIVVAAHDLMIGGKASIFVSVLVLAVCAVRFVAGGRSIDPVSELWAVARTGHVCLFRSGDKQAFDQIRRALVRARGSRQE